MLLEQTQKRLGSLPASTDADSVGPWQLDEGLVATLLTLSHIWFTEALVKMQILVLVLGGA